MKTIEERANEYIGHPFDVDEDVSITMARDSYFKGATEQKAIDDAERDVAVYNLLLLKLDAEKKLWLNKACKWIRGLYPPLDTGYNYTRVAEEMVKKFCQAMEE